MALIREWVGERGVGLVWRVGILLCHWNEYSLMQAQSITLYLFYFLYKVETLVDLDKIS